MNWLKRRQARKFQDFLAWCMDPNIPMDTIALSLLGGCSIATVCDHLAEMVDRDLVVAINDEGFIEWLLKEGS